MKAIQIPHKRKTILMIMMKKVASLVSCENTSGRRIIFSMHNDAEVKINLNGIGTVISKWNTGYKSSMIADIVD